MKLELGGGPFPRGEGFVNLDRVPGADVVFDLDTIPPGYLPFGDETVAEVYSSHALEHLRDPLEVLREIARVCRVGAPVEIRVPHWLSDIAMSPGHTCVLGPVAVRNICHFFLTQHWTGRPRRLELLREEYSPSAYFGELKGLYPAWTDDQLLRLCPGAAHDVRFHFEVTAYAGEPGEAEAPGGSHAR